MRTAPLENLELTLNGNKERFRDEEFKRMGLLASLAVTLVKTVVSFTSRETKTKQ